MIKVNLLPPEYRVKERTPLPMMLGILAGVIVTSLVVVAFLYLRLVELPNIKRELNAKNQSKKLHMEKAKKADELQLELSNLEVLNKAVANLKGKRYPWTKAVDDLCWMVAKANQHKKHVKAWYEKLDFGFATPRGGRGAPAAKPSGELEVNVVVAGREFDHVGVFREVIDKSEGWLGRNVFQMPLTSTKVKPFQDYIPDVGLSFPLTITLHPEPQIETPAEEEKAGAGKGAGGASTPDKGGARKKGG
jgi:hypothetical protein